MKKIRWVAAAGAFVLCAILGDVCLAQMQPDFSAPSSDTPIQRGAKFILHQQDSDGTWDSLHFRLAEGGADALALMAVLKSSDAGDTPAMNLGLQQLAKRKSRRTFTRAMRVRVLSLGIESQRANLRPRSPYSAPMRRKSPTPLYRRTIRKDVEWLIKTQTPEGGWSLSGRAEKNAPLVPNTTDTSYAIVALQSAEQLGVEIPDEVWTLAEKFLHAAQNSDGGFGYYPPNTRPIRLRGASHGLTTAQGAVALETLIARRRDIDAAERERENSDSDPNKLALAHALEWLGQQTKVQSVPEWYWGDEPLYEYLYALTETCVGAKHLDLDSPLKLRDIAKFLRKMQNPDGSWTGSDLAENPTTATSFAIASLWNIRELHMTPAPEFAANPNEHTEPQNPEPHRRALRSGLKIARLVRSNRTEINSQLIPTLSKSLKGAYSIGIDEIPITPGRKIPTSVPMAWLTCNDYSDLLRIQSRAMRNYLNTGGVLLIDTSRTDKNLFINARIVLSRLFDGGMLVKLTPDDPLINGDFSGKIGNNISKVTYRRTRRSEVEKFRQAPVLWGLKFNGRLVAIVCKGSLSGAITEQTKNGYTSRSAQRIVLNALLYANSIKPKPTEPTRWVSE